MKVCAILTAVSATMTLTTLAAPTVKTAPADTEATEQLETRSIAGLNGVQSRNAYDIIAQAIKDNVGLQGCEAAIATGLTESGLRILANNGVAASMSAKHDGTGSDGDSVGVFQQRASIYKDIACDMKPGCSAGLFFRDLKAVDGWQKMDVAALCQKVQRSEIPDAYKKFTSTASAVCKSQM